MPTEPKRLHSRTGVRTGTAFDSTKARSELGWSPRIDFVSGIDEVVAWVETNWDVLRNEPWEYQHKP